MRIVLLLLLFTIRAHANGIEAFTISVEQGQPKFAFFDVSTGDIFVSVQDEKEARVDRYSSKGELKEKRLLRGSGTAGALRSFDGNLYWSNGDRISTYHFERERTSEVGDASLKLGAANSLAIDRDGTIYLGFASGKIARVIKKKGVVLGKDQPVTGMFLLERSLFLLRQNQLVEFSLEPWNSSPLRTDKEFCASSCRSLERNSAGEWLTIEASTVKAVKKSKPKLRAKKLFEAPSEIGSLGYVFRKDPNEDLLLVVLPSERKVKALKASLLPKAG